MLLAESTFMIGEVLFFTFFTSVAFAILTFVDFLERFIDCFGSKSLSESEFLGRDVFSPSNWVIVT